MDLLEELQKLVQELESAKKHLVKAEQIISNIRTQIYDGYKYHAKIMGALVKIDHVLSDLYRSIESYLYLKSLKEDDNK